MIVNTCNFKKDQFDVIFDVPEDSLSPVEMHETQIINSFWAFIQCVWNLRSQQATPIQIELSEKLKEFLELIKEENLKSMFDVSLDVD